MDEIKDQISRAALFEQLAEEASELTHAALKYARKLRGENPTPVSFVDAYNNVIEEYTDVIQCARILTLGVNEQQILNKNDRWLNRLRGDIIMKDLKGLKVYIAGKITGDANFKEKFAKAKKEFEDQGAIVLNPADLPAGMTPADYMRICLPMVDSSDLVFFLRDHIHSSGAHIELVYSEYIGKSMVFES